MALFNPSSSGTCFKERVRMRGSPRLHGALDHQVCPSPSQESPRRKMLRKAAR